MPHHLRHHLLLSVFLVGCVAPEPPSERSDPEADVIDQGPLRGGVG